MAILFCQLEPEEVQVLSHVRLFRIQVHTKVPVPPVCTTADRDFYWMGGLISCRAFLGAGLQPGVTYTTPCSHDAPKTCACVAQCKAAGVNFFPEKLCYNTSKIFAIDEFDMIR